MGEIIIGKHTLESLTTGMYSDPFVVYREYIQNSVDSIDTAVQCGIIEYSDAKIDIQLIPLEQKIVIKDNGVGIKSKEAEKLLISIGNSKKKSQVARGFRGIGRLCALSYCDKLQFITTYTGENKGTKITIDAKKLSSLLSAVDSEDVTAAEVLANVYTKESFSAKETDHYFVVQMEGVDHKSNLNSYDDALEYLSQNAPVPYSSDFVWGKEIVNRLKKDGGTIRSYNINLQYGTRVVSVCKPYCDRILVDKGKNLYDTIKDIKIIKIKKPDGSMSAIGWIAETDFHGSIYDKSVKGIRLRKGNIQIGDNQSLNIIFKDARFNGWSVGEIFADDPLLIPNARRDNFEKNPAYFNLYEQLTTMAADITKNIRAASINRNQMMAAAIDSVDAASKIATKAIEEGVASPKKGAITQKLKSAQALVNNASISDALDENYQTIAFDELDMLIGKIKGATSYKALNTVANLTNTEKKILERVFNSIEASKLKNADKVIEIILSEFSSK